MTLLIQFDFWKQVHYYLYMYFVSYTVGSFSFIGPMFYTFVGLLGRNFVGAWFIVVQCRTFQWFVIRLWRCEQPIKSMNIKSPRNNDDSTVRTTLLQ